MSERGAVILAAGAGTRLGGVAKALLVGPSQRTFLSSILTTATEVGLAHAIVVVGPPHGDAVSAVARQLGAFTIVNAYPERGMASSVALGFAAIAATPCTAAWLWPVDHPHVTAATLRALIAALDDHAVARPVVAGRRGHPPLIARALFARLAACGARGQPISRVRSASEPWPEGPPLAGETSRDQSGGAVGARAVLADADVVDVAVDDPGCVRDVDTARDLEGA